MTSAEAMQERAHILSDAEGPAREARQGLPKKAKALAACGVLVVVAVAGWQMHRLLARPTLASSKAGVSHFLAEKAEHKTEDQPEQPVFDEAFGRSVLDKADDNFEKVTDMKGKSEDDMKAAKEFEKESKASKAEAKDNINDAVEQITQAGKDSEEADETEASAKEAIKKAGQAKMAAAKDILAAKDTIMTAKEESDAAKEKAAQAASLEKVAQEKKDKVAVVEQEAMEKTGEGRVCVDLPGVQLADARGEDAFDPIAVDKKTDTAEACTLWCQQHDGCAQAKFNSWSKKCKLFKGTTTDAKSYRDGFNSSYCGKPSDKKDMKDLIKKAMSHQPDIPPVVDCAWDGEDCSKSNCCNDETCDWEFSECTPFTCYGGGEGATCMSACYGDECEEKGSGREQRETTAAKKGILTQGSSLYCFMVVAWDKEGRDEWSDSEGALANNIKEKKVGIYECDGHDIFDGELTAVTEWSTYLNADLYIGVWKKVQENGKYAAHSWTVKVDVDAVFFPTILKSHIGGLKTPQGSRVYLRNIEHKYMFLGALEVLTREAVDLYFEKGWVCEQKDHDKFAEDYYLKHCLDAIGCDHQVDTDLLNDRSTNPEATTQDCSSGWTVAYHWQRSMDDWNKCHKTALAAQDEARKLWKSEHPE